jgi:hypothetical protein
MILIVIIIIIHLAANMDLLHNLGVDSVRFLQSEFKVSLSISFVSSSSFKSLEMFLFATCILTYKCILTYITASKSVEYFCSL